MAIYWFGGFAIADNGETSTSNAIHILGGGVITKPISIFENQIFGWASTRSSLEASHVSCMRILVDNLTRCCGKSNK
jgi:hypothetical protein